MSVAARAIVDTQGSFGATSGSDDPGALLALADNANLAINARKNVLVENIYNPSITPNSEIQNLATNPTQSVTFENPTSFFTYGKDSSVSLSTFGGDITYTNDVTNIAQLLFGTDTLGFVPQVNFTVLPANVFIGALSGDVVINGDEQEFSLYPSAVSNFDILAGNDITLNAAISQLDLPDELVPTINSPIESVEDDIAGANTTPVETFSAAFTYEISSDDAFNSNLRKHSDPSIHTLADAQGRVDNRNSRVVAQNGSVIFSGDNREGIVSAEAIDIFAGENIINPTVFIQNTSNFDVSSIIAENSIISELVLQQNGRFPSNLQRTGIYLDGPGRFDVVSGKDIDLGVSAGVIGRGNTVNSFLSSDPATINLIAGFTDFDTQGKCIYSSIFCRWWL